MLKWCLCTYKSRHQILSRFISDHSLRFPLAPILSLCADAIIHDGVISWSLCKYLHPVQRPHSSAYTPHLSSYTNAVRPVVSVSSPDKRYRMAPVPLFSTRSWETTSMRAAFEEWFIPNYPPAPAGFEEYVSGASYMGDKNITPGTVKGTPAWGTRFTSLEHLGPIPNDHHYPHLIPTSRGSPACDAWYLD